MDVLSRPGTWNYESTTLVGGRLGTEARSTAKVLAIAYLRGNLLLSCNYGRGDTGIMKCPDSRLPTPEANLWTIFNTNP